MAVKPKIVTLTNSSVDVLNAIRNSASVNYRNYVPIATSDPDRIKEIGAVLMDRPALQNEFLDALVNRIGYVYVASKAYQNPWSMFKKGMMEFGETVEEVFVDLVRVFEYDPAVAESEVYKREKPDVRSAFHIRNYRKFYKSTFQQEELRAAFTGEQGVTDMITRFVEQIYGSAEYDEFITMKYMVAKDILNGHFYPVAVGSDTDPDYAKNVTKIVKGVSNDITFMKTKYNMAGVHQHTKKSDQYILVNAAYQAVMDVDSLATAFNMDKVEFMGHVILVDSFGDMDTERLNELFADDPTYTEIGSDDLALLDAIPLVLVDNNYFMIFDNLRQFADQPNKQGLYWQYFYHVWMTFSTSPFSNAIVFTQAVPAITSVTVNPGGVSVLNTFEGSIPLDVDVVTTGFQSKAVNWTITTDLTDTGVFATISKGGVLTIRLGENPEPPASITVRATSVIDPLKYDECVVTLVDPQG